MVTAILTQSMSNYQVEVFLQTINMTTEVVRKEKVI